MRVACGFGGPGGGALVWVVELGADSNALGGRASRRWVKLKA
ncbi:hypothetical protein ABZ636_13240 [Streptomyces sp. NPDC007251]